jgi:PPM family protein phosphatase
LVSLKSWSGSDIGRKRANNEDCCFHDPALGLFMVADGMGGHRGGDQASKIAIEIALKAYQEHTANQAPHSIALQRAMGEAAKMVYQTSISESGLRGMGTTLSALAVIDDSAMIAHIGDTRIYCMRDGVLHQLTRDHSLVNERVQAGLMTTEEARSSSLRHIITRAIGHDERVQADHFTLPIKKNDLFILCSDGLNNMLHDTEIIDIINRFSPNKAIRQLILEANRKGGDDNITVVLVKAQ